MPTLDLGELGAQIDAALRDEAPDEAAPANETPEPVAAASDDTAEPAPSVPEGEPAADAGADDFEARFEERFKDEYQKRSSADIAKLRSSLDKQIAHERKRAEGLSFDVEESSAFIEHILKTLAEYDPQEAERARQARESVRSREKDRRELTTMRRQQVEDQRASYYAKAFPDLDPNHPRLRAAFEAGDHRAEAELAHELAELAQLRAERERPAPPVEAPKATPERNEKGQFVAAKAAATERREAARGTIPVAGAVAPVADVPLDQASRERHFKARLASMGIG